MAMNLSQIPPQQRAAYLRTVAQLEATPPQVRALIAEEAVASQKSILPVIYYSTLRFATARTGAGPFTYTVPQQTIKAFGYKEGDVMDAAGFPAGTVATGAETNLVTGGSQTNEGADVVVWGLALEPLPGSSGEPLILFELVNQVFFELSLNASNRFRIGKLTDMPQGGGLHGAAKTRLRAGALADANSPDESALANGNPMAGNYYKLPYPFRWNAIGNNKKDTALVISATVARAIAVTSADRAAVAGAAPGASGQVEAFTSPANLAAGTFQDVRVKLACIQIGERSLNS